MDKKRLYRQATEGASEILKILLEYQLPYSRSFELLAPDLSYEFTNARELATTARNVKQIVQERCRLLEPYYCIPILIEFISRFYERHRDPRRTNWGASAKFCMALIWDNIDNPDRSMFKSYGDISDAIVIASFYLQLDNLLTYWDFYNIRYIAFHTDGFTGGRELRVMEKETILQGRHEYKTLNHAIDHIWLKLPEFIPKLNIIALRGVEPRALFENTLLGEIKDKSFWYKLWARFLLMTYIFKERASLSSVETADIKGIAILSKEYVVAQPFWGDPKLVQESIEGCFWKRTWYESLLKQETHDLSDAVVRRPALRIMAEEHLFATSYMLVQDSINSLLEGHILSNQGGVLFEKYVSKPFEQKAIDVFRQCNLECGEVTDSQLWVTKKANIFLENKLKTTIPGQIDLLAEVQNEIVVADCKALLFPYSAKRLRNLRGKIGEEDADGFFSKLKKKAKWIKGTKTFDGKNVHHLLITDRYVPYSLTSHHLTLTIRQVEQCLQLELPFGKWKDHILKDMGLFETD